MVLQGLIHEFTLLGESIAFPPDVHQLINHRFLVRR